MSEIKFRFLAYYLPQFHPVKENDEWWGKGFTEWTNVTKAVPLFKGHYQPRFPADLGYYDLRVPEIKEAQATMAKAHGVEGFIYYHYWFGNGKKILEYPLQEILRTGKPDFPFCVCWANESWKGAWFGTSQNKTLVEQSYPGIEDYREHFYYLLPAFKDSRYIKVNGKPVFFLYLPLSLPDVKVFTNLFNELAIKEGLPGIYFIASRVPLEWHPAEYGFDAVVGTTEHIKQNISRDNRRHGKVKKRIFNKMNRLIPSHFPVLKDGPGVFEYKDVVEYFKEDIQVDYDYYPLVIPNWDNTPRAGHQGTVYNNCTPELFYEMLQNAAEKVSHLPPERRFIIVKSWNEWAEGNYLEPDTVYGYKYLEQIKKCIFYMAE